MPIPMVVMGFAIVAYILCTILAAYTYPSTQNKKTEFGLCLGGVIAAIMALGSVFWMP